MNPLDIFALIVLIVLVVAGVAVRVMLGMLPGKIARRRQHPQAEAINVCGWWGAVTFGVLLPVAWVWAYTKVGSDGDRPLEPIDAADKGRAGNIDEKVQA